MAEIIRAEINRIPEDVVKITKFKPDGMCFLHIEGLLFSIKGTHYKPEYIQIFRLPDVVEIKGDKYRITQLRAILLFGDESDEVFDGRGELRVYHKEEDESEDYQFDFRDISIKIKEDIEAKEHVLSG